MRRITAWAFAATLACATGASAATLTCEHYKQRLNEKLAATDIGGIQDYRPARGDDNGLAQFKFGGGLGVDGLLTCDKNGVFNNLEFGLKPTSGFGTTYPAKFLTLAAASMCAITSSDMATCSNVVAHTSVRALEKFKAKVASGERYPDAEADVHLFAPDNIVGADVNIAGPEYGWMVGPGRFSKMDDALKPLKPEDVPGVD